MIKPTPRQEVMNQPLDEAFTPEYFDPTVSPEFRNVENSKEILEHTMIQTFLNIMNSGKNDNSRIKAARNAGELVGQLNQKNQQVNLIQAENVQMNQIAQNPALKNHLVDAALGLKQISFAHDSGIKTKEGGSGV